MKQFYCLAYCDPDHVPITDDELDELYHAFVLESRKSQYPT